MFVSAASVSSTIVNPVARPSSSRSLRSAQSRKRVPSFFALASLRSVPQAGSQFLRARCAQLSPASGFPVSSRSLRSAQSPQAGPKFRMYHFTFVIFDLDQMKRSKESRSDPGYGLTHTKLCESFFRKGVS